MDISAEMLQYPDIVNESKVFPASINQTAVMPKTTESVKKWAETEAISRVESCEQKKHESFFSIQKRNFREFARVAFLSMESKTIIVVECVLPKRLRESLLQN